MSSQNWYILYTLTNHEKKVFSRLSRKSLMTYLPVQKVIRQWSDRKKKVVVPLFPNYVFVKCEPTALYYLLFDSSIIRFLTEENQPVTISEKEINRIKILTKADTKIDVSNIDKGLIPGVSIEVTDGPLSGLEGRLIQIKGRQRLLVEINTLNKALKVDLPANYLKPTEAYSPCKVG